MNGTVPEVSNSTLCWVLQPQRADPVIIMGLIALPIMCMVLWATVMCCEIDDKHRWCGGPLTHRYQCTSNESETGDSYIGDPRRSSRDSTSSYSIQSEKGSTCSSGSMLLDISTESQCQPIAHGANGNPTELPPWTERNNEIIPYIQPEKLGTYV